MRRYHSRTSKEILKVASKVHNYSIYYMYLFGHVKGDTFKTYQTPIQQNKTAQSRVLLMCFNYSSNITQPNYSLVIIQ